MASDDIPAIDAALATAIHTRDFERAAQLLQHGGQINRVVTRTETFDRDVVEETSTYLIDAAITGNTATVSFLLQHGANPNIASSYSTRTALLEAARLGHSAIVDLLLAHGAEIVAIDRYSGETALGYATGKVNPAIVRSLLIAGATASFRRLGFSVVGGAGAREVVRLLMEHGADINEVDDWGRTPLMWAAQYAEPETIEFMIGVGAEVDRVSEVNMNGVRSYETALGLARERKDEDVVAVLVQHGAREAASGGFRGAPWLTRWWKRLTR